MDCAGARLYELLRDGRFVLLDATTAPARGDGSPGRAQVAARWADRARAVSCRPAAVPGLPRMVLVRPDGYVAWASDTPSGDDAVAAVSAWCGPAAFTEERQAAPAG